MVNFISKCVPQLRHSLRTSLAQELRFLQFNTLSIEAAKPISQNEKSSFTVNYLINKCGLAPEKALAASKSVKFEKPDKPDAVIEFLKNQGFSGTHITKLIKNFPPVILCDVEKTLLPKFEFLASQGVSKADLPAIFAATPTILKSSMEKTIAPTFYSYKDLLGNVEDTCLAVKRQPQILCCLRSYVAPNIEILRKASVPEVNIAYLLKTHPRVFVIRSNRFKQLVEEINKMGIDPRKIAFVAALKVMAANSSLSWEKKLEIYKSWGCSEDEVLMAFTKNPWCMAVSEGKIKGIMEFFVYKMGMKPSFLMKNPIILSLSLNNRIIPRCSVHGVLLSKGLIKDDINICSMLKISEKLFLERYVEKFVGKLS